MEYVKLEDVVDIYLGLTHTPTYVDDGVPFLSVKDISDGKIIFDKCHFIKEEEYNSLPNGARPKVGDMLFCRVGTIGKPVIIEEGIPKFGTFVSLGFLRNKNEEKTLLKYLLYWMNSELFFKQVRQNVKGASQVNLNTGWLSKFVLPSYSLDIQNEIVCILDKITALINKRKQQLSKLDELVKARFVELFGDRYINDRKWESKPLYECADFYNGKAHEQVVDENGEYILVTSRCIASDITDYRRTNELLFPLQVNDIAMVMSDVPNGRALAKCILIDEDNKYTLNQRICCLRNYSLNPIFFYYLLNRHEYFLSFNDGNAQTNLRKDDLLACNIIVPPLELQELFAFFVEQTDKSKLEVQKSLEKLELLKKALMQKYFG